MTRLRDLQDQTSGILDDLVTIGDDASELSADDQRGLADSILYIESLARLMREALVLGIAGEVLKRPS